MDESFVQELERIAWFSACGQPVSSPLPFAVEQVGSVAEAIESCSGPAWEDTTLEARNALTVYLHAHHRDAYQRWNSLANEANVDIIAPLAEHAWRPFADASGMGKDLLDAVSWDVLAAVMEHAYRDCRGRPAFFLQLLEVYRAGHFPCGWEGQWPDGVLLVW